MRPNSIRCSIAANLERQSDCTSGHLALSAITWVPSLPFIHNNSTKLKMSISIISANEDRGLRISKHQAPCKIQQGLAQKHVAAFGDMLARNSTRIQPLAVKESLLTFIRFALDLFLKECSHRSTRFKAVRSVQCHLGQDTARTAHIQKAISQSTPSSGLSRRRSVFIPAFSSSLLFLPRYSKARLLTGRQQNNASCITVPHTLTRIRRV
jgi:hypothetical protein